MIPNAERADAADEDMAGAAITVPDQNCKPEHLSSSDSLHPDAGRLQERYAAH